MALAARLERFLARKGITYRELPIDQVTSLDAAVIASGMSQDSFVQATLLIDITGVVMAVHKFDSSLDRGTPLQFKVDAGQVIKGMDQAVMDMRAGGKRTIIIPPELGYGSRGAGGVIPPNSHLVFEIELLEAK